MRTVGLSGSPPDIRLKKLRVLNQNPVPRLLIFQSTLAAELLSEIAVSVVALKAL